MTILVLLAAAAAALITYLLLERTGRSSVVPATARTVVWAVLGLLLLNTGCPREDEGGAPLVVLDGSLSFRTDSARFYRLVDSARSLAGEVVFAGDSRPASDSAARGRSQVANGVVAALASGRPVELWTDGEVTDWLALPADAREMISVVPFARTVVPQLALPHLAGPERVTAGDSVVIRGEVASYGAWQGDSVSLQAAVGSRTVGSARLALGPAEGRRAFSLTVRTGGLTPGDHLVEVQVQGASPLPEAAARWHRLRVVAQPGVVMVADPADWDARFLYRAMIEVAELPVRGYQMISPGSWHRMSDLSPVAASEVESAGRRAELVVVKGRSPSWLGSSRARAVLLWPSGENGEARIAGDWYLSGGTSSPVAPHLAALPLDSFPPVESVTPVEPGEDEWVALSAQEGRRGALRPVIVGRDARQRRITISADGLWRWPFSGGSAEQGYRTLVAELTGWLLARPDSAAGAASPVSSVVERARPVVFRWQESGAPEPLAVEILTSDSSWMIPWYSAGTVCRPFIFQSAPTATGSPRGGKGSSRLNRTRGSGCQDP